jgi:invasion protein IalB
MKNLILTAIAAVTLAAAIPAFAQDTTTATTEEFPIGKSPDVQIGQPYVLKQEGSWQVRCVKAEVEPESCFIYQLLKDSEGNSVAEVNIFHLPGGGAAVAGANIITPLGTLLQNQVMLSIGGEAPKPMLLAGAKRLAALPKSALPGWNLKA